MVEDIVAALSVQIFRVPIATVEEAREVSKTSHDHSLIEELSRRGFLNDMERAFLEDLSLRLDNPEAPTVTGFPGMGANRKDGAPSQRSREGQRESLAPSRPVSLDLHNDSRYSILKEQGRGGMGRVLAVWDERMGREVALKELLPQSTTRHEEDRDSGEARERVIARFLQEAQVTGRLQHPSIIPVHEIGERADGTLYYTMKCVHGQTLRDAIRKADSLEARMALLPHYVSLCQAMAYAHTHGVIHRDLKPSNVMIGEFGETLVIDWGLAKERGAGDGVLDGSIDPAENGDGEMRDGLTMDGQLLGTPHYMAPEQAAGQHATLDERADVYALGAVLYHLLTGQRPFESLSGVDVLRQVVRKPSLSPAVACPGIPAALEAICMRAMAHDPAERYSSAKALAEEIVRFQSGAVVAAYNYGLSDHVVRIVKKHKPVVLTSAIFVLMLLSLVCYTVYSLQVGKENEYTLRKAAEQESYDLSVALAQRSMDELQYDEVERILEESPPDFRGWEWGRLNYTVSSLRRSYPHPATLADMALNGQGDRLVTIDFEGNGRLWSVPDFQLIRSYDLGKEAWVVAFRPDGKEFATTGVEGVIQRWDVESDRAVAEYQSTGSSCCTLIYSRDGRYLVTAGMDDAISQWDLDTGQVVRRIATPNGVINKIALSPDGKWLAAADETGLVLLWDWEKGDLIYQREAHMISRQLGVLGAIWVEFSPDGNTLLSTGCDATAKSWDRATGTLNFTLESFVSRVWSAGYATDERTIFTTTEGLVQFWDARTGEEKPSWIRGDGASKRAMLLPGGQEMVSVGSSNLIRRWRLDLTPENESLDGGTSPMNGVRFSPDGTALAATGGHWKAGGDGRVRLWQGIGNEQSVPALPLLLEGPEGWSHPLDFHPNGEEISAGARGGQIFTWDRRAGTLLREFNLPQFKTGIRCLAYRADGNALFVTGWADVDVPVVVELSTDDGTILREFSDQLETIDSVACSPDGRYLAAGSRDGSACVWDLKTGKLYRKFVEDLGWVYGVAFSPDSRYLATSHNGSLVNLWDLARGEKVRVLGGLHDRVNKVTFSPDGTRVAACDTNSVKVWSATTGAALITLPHGAYDVAFSPDGRILAAAGIDDRVWTWHASAWK